MGRQSNKSKNGMKLVVGIIVVVGICAALYFRMEDDKVKDDLISLESIVEGNTRIYCENQELYTVVDIKKSGKWLEDNEIPEECRELEDELGNSYAELIIKQFMPEEVNGKFSAKALKRAYSKKELETFYLNTVYLGDGVYGLSNASKRFLGCYFDELSEEQFTWMRNIIIEYVTENSYNDIMLYEESMVYEEHGYADGVVKEAAAYLQKSGMDELTAYNAIFFGDMEIYTYLDTKVQKVVDEAYQDKSVFTPDNSEKSYMQSAMVIMDTEGKIKAVASGNNKDKVFNRAVSRKYQVGSTIKPVSAYALGIENGLIHFSSMIPNIQTLMVDQYGKEDFWPTNTDDEYGGEVSVTKGLQQSKNTIAVEIGRMVGEQTMFDFLDKKLGYDLTLYENQNSDCQLSALTLGYFYRGISLAKLASSYQMFAENGNFYDSSMISKISAEDGTILYEDNRTGDLVLSEETAYIMNRLLYNNVYGEDGIAKNAAIDGAEVLGKTGTVGNGNGMSTSRLFVGIAGEYIASVWIGYDEENVLTFKKYHVPDMIFSDIMSRLELKQTEWNRPDGVREEDYCEVSGELATEFCSEKQKGYYASDCMPKECLMCKDNVE